MRRSSLIFGLVIGGLWMAEVILANVSPLTHDPARMFALAAVAATAVCGYVTAAASGRIATALRVGVWSGLLSGAMVFVTGMAVVVLFHDVMMRDPANIHEFALSAHRAPTQAELSRFLYSDMFAGTLNHLWIGPMLGVTIGLAGAIVGKHSR